MDYEIVLVNTNDGCKVNLAPINDAYIKAMIASNKRINKKFILTADDDVDAVKKAEVWLTKHLGEDIKQGDYNV